MRHIARRKLIRMNCVSVARKSILFLVGSSCNTDQYCSLQHPASTDEVKVHVKVPQDFT